MQFLLFFLNVNVKESANKREASYLYNKKLLGELKLYVMVISS